MKIALFSAKPYDRKFFKQANAEYGYELVYFEPHLSEATAQLASGFPVVCAFTNDQLDRAVLEKLAAQGTSLIALRCAGYNNVDLEAAKDLNITVVRVPAYSPYAVAEHTVGLVLALNRKIYRAYNRVREGNFTIDGLLGFDLHGRTVGIIGMGRIGQVTADIFKGFGCRVLAFDPAADVPSEESGVQYVPLEALLAQSDIVSLHCPLNEKTHHLINNETIARMKDGVMLVNTGRGGLVDTRAVIRGLKSGKIGYLGLDVYEEEADIFFEDLSNQTLQDDLLARLMTFNNVIITSHQAFFTQEAMQNIAQTTLANICAVERGMDCPNQLVAGKA